MSRETYALLISGDEPKHVDKVVEFKLFLLNELNFDPKKVCEILDSEERSILVETGLFFEKVNSENSSSDVIILYPGHGGKGEFFPKGSLAYTDWGRLIVKFNNF